MRKEDRRKVYNRIRAMVEVGDVFYTLYQNNLYLLQVKEVLDNRFEGACLFEMIDPYEFTSQINDYYLDHKPAKMKQLLSKAAKRLLAAPKTQSPLLQNLTPMQLSEVNLPAQVNSLVPLGGIDFMLETELHLMLELGLFEEILYDGVKYRIPSINNDRESIIGRQEAQFFDVYVPYNFTGPLDLNNIYRNPYYNPFDYIRERKKYDYGNGVIYFKRLHSIDTFYEEVYGLNYNLLLDIEDIQCGFAKPYGFESNIQQTITNHAGNSYPFCVVYQYITSRAQVYGMNQKIFINEFSRYYQPKIGGLYDFSSEEIKKLINTYLIFSPFTGFYSYWDTKEYLNGGYYVFDKTFFKVIYNNLVKNNKIDSINDIHVPKLSDRQKFEYFTISKDEFTTIKNIFFKSSNLDDFLNACYEYFKYECVSNFGVNEAQTIRILEREKELRVLFASLCEKSCDLYDYGHALKKSIILDQNTGLVEILNENGAFDTFYVQNWDSMIDNYILNYFIDDGVEFRKLHYSIESIDKMRIIYFK